MKRVILQTVRKGRQWWVTGLHRYDATAGDLGPYRTRAEADDDRLGVQRFFRTIRDEGKNANKKHD